MPGLPFGKTKGWAFPIHTLLKIHTLTSRQVVLYAQMEADAMPDTAHGLAKRLERFEHVEVIDEPSLKFFRQSL